MADLISTDLFSWVVLPILIILARMVDVTLGTIRIIFVSRGSRLAAPILGFFEVFVWIVAISQIMQNLNNPLCYVAYALGFALGNYLGITAEEKLAIGYLVLRIFVIKENQESDSLMEKLIEAGFGVTAVEGRGATKEVTLLFSLIRRKDLNDAVAIIEQADSKVFYSIESAKAAHAGIFPDKKSHGLSFVGNEDTRRRISGGYRKRK